MKKIPLMLAIAVLSFSCKNAADKAEVYQDTKEATIDSMKIEMDKQKIELARQKSIDSMKLVQAEAEKNQQSQRPVVINNTTPATAEQKRKGWSGAAKGAVIGAGVGAVTGAVISKDKPAQGAVIGGLAGAGIGAGTGAILDDKKKKN